MAGLLEEDFLRKLERLTLISRKVRAGSLKGERRSPKRGTSVQFADYRDYYHGDDLRQVDWNIYARLEKVFLKLFEEEEELSVHILVDASRSMDWNGPALNGDEADATKAATHPHNKLDYARRTAASIGYVALSATDMVTVGALGADTAALAALNVGALDARIPLLRGKNQVLRLLRFISAIRPAAQGKIIDGDGQVLAKGGDVLNAAMIRYAREARTPGLLVLISDLLSPAGAFDGLRALQGAGHEVVVLHTLSPDEMRPELRGDFQLVDSETGAMQEVSIDSNAIALYNREFKRWTGEIQAFCGRRGINYVQVDTSQPFDELVLHYLRQRGIMG